MFLQWSFIACGIGSNFVAIAHGVFYNVSKIQLLLLLFYFCLLFVYKFFLIFSLFFQLFDI